MENTEKVEIGYTVPKERWQEAAKNLEELGNVLAAGLLKQNKDGRGKRGRGRHYGGHYAGLHGALPCGGVRNG